jgi:hypothetical protein
MKLISIILIKNIFIFSVLFLSLISNSNSDSKKLISPNPVFISLLEDAKKLMNYQGVIALPRLFSLNEKDLQKLYCAGVSKCNTITAMYDDGSLYFDEDFDAKHPVWRSIIFHEMVHHIQFVRSGGAKNCEIWFKKEHEAYKLQATYLRMNGESDKVVIDSEKNIICP